MHKNDKKKYYDYTCTRWAVFSLSAERSIRVMKHELPFSIDLIPIDMTIHTFLNETPTNDFPFENFPLGQFLLIVLSVKVTYIRNRYLGGLHTLRGALQTTRAHIWLSNPALQLQTPSLRNMIQLCKWKEKSMKKIITLHVVIRKYELSRTRKPTMIFNCSWSCLKTEISDTNSYRFQFFRSLP